MDCGTHLMNIKQSLTRQVHDGMGIRAAKLRGKDLLCLLIRAPCVCRPEKA